MRKLTLNVDALAVESFETAAQLQDTGTVQARGLAPAEPQPADTSKIWSCDGSCVTCTDCNTCISCQITCFDATCTVGGICETARSRQKVLVSIRYISSDARGLTARPWRIITSASAISRGVVCPQP